MVARPKLASNQCVGPTRDGPAYNQLHININCISMATTDEDIAELTVREIIVRFKNILTLSREERSKKDILIAHILQDGLPEQLNFLRQAGQNKRQAKLEGTEVRTRKRKQRETNIRYHRRQAARREESGQEFEAVREEGEAICCEASAPEDHSQFLSLPTDDEVKACYRAFYESTSNAALASKICAVCARELFPWELAVNAFSLDQIPNVHRLIPKRSHTAHSLVAGKLFDQRGLTTDGATTIADICSECVRQLKGKEDRPPALSLANNMWIGDVPWQLQVLTFSEQLLISLIYPRVYVFKLFPKKRGSGQNPETLQRAMQGNVTSYELSIPGVAKMAKGLLLPRSPAILASIISITFIGLGTLPKDWLRNTFRVRRQAVLEALRWLKENNPKYYGDIEISPRQMAELPEDDVLIEVLSMVRQSEDVGVVEKESEGYVPLDPEVDDEQGAF